MATNLQPVTTDSGITFEPGTLDGSETIPSGTAAAPTTTIPVIQAIQDGILGQTAANLGTQAGTPGSNLDNLTVGLQGAFSALTSIPSTLSTAGANLVTGVQNSLTSAENTAESALATAGIYALLGVLLVVGVIFLLVGNNGQNAQSAIVSAVKTGPEGV